MDTCSTCKFWKDATIEVTDCDYSTGITSTKQVVKHCTYHPAWIQTSAHHYCGNHQIDMHAYNSPQSQEEKR